jgi:nucleotide-binding universal stress UspA family protein
VTFSAPPQSRAAEAHEVPGLATLVVGHDGTERGRDALALGEALAEGTGARLVIARVLPAVDSTVRAEAQADLAAVDIDRLGVQARTEAIAAATPAEGLEAIADREGGGLIVIGSTHRGHLGSLGSLGHRLVHGSHFPFAVAQPGLALDPPRFEIVGAAFDMSPESEAAVGLAAGLAGDLDASVRVIAVVPRAARHFDDGPGDFEGSIGSPHGRLLTGLERELRSLPEDVAAEARLLEGDPAGQLLEEAGRSIDLLVIGSRGRGAVGRAVAGSVSISVLDAAPCPVVVVPRPR